MNLTELHPRLRQLPKKGRLLGGLLVAAVIPVMAIAAGPIAYSTFVGAEDPLSENGAWAALTSLSPNGGRFQKNNGAFPDRLGPDHAGARTTAIVPADHYSEIVVGHVGNVINIYNNVGPTVRVQVSGPSIDSHYLWWASGTNGLNNLYRVDANGTSYTASPILPTSPVLDGDRLRLIARGPVIYGLKNGVRNFIYNTGSDTTKYSTGTAGMLAYTAGPSLTEAMITSWSSDAAPASSGTWGSSNFVGAEDPLDEGDRWYPLPTYSGFQKVGGLAMGKDWGHNASGVWSITPPAKQYSEVTLGTVTRGGGGPIVRIDRTNSGQTGWLLFLAAENPSLSGIYKMIPGGFTPVLLFTPLIVSGDHWRLTADGNILQVSLNGTPQFTYTTDGSYAAGDVGIEAYTPQFTFMAWQGGDTAGGPATPSPALTVPGAPTVTAASSSKIRISMAVTNDVRVTGYLVERCQGVACISFAQIGIVTGATYDDEGLAPNTSYTYRVRAQDGVGDLSPYSSVATATTFLF